ncbi:hypothetical protein DDI74_18305 [Chryseobacterium gleum]|nr:hypothetical protein DDI74_18305 [Chryseobacterium gleum]
MLKANFLNIIFYILVKYLVFYIFIMFKNDNFYLINPGIRDGVDLLYYLWMFLFFPVIGCILFLAPIYYSFKIRKWVYFILINIIILSAEYCLYTYLASQLDLWNGIYNVIISAILFWVFFHKLIKAKFINL